MLFLDRFILAFDIGGLIWRGLWIFLLSIGFTYSVSSLGHPPRSHPPTITKIARNRVIEARRRRIEITLAIEREKQRIWTLENTAFPFVDLPPEVQLTVLSHCADWTSTYLSLTQVSWHMYHFALKACLPRMAITLYSARQISSFFDILHSHPHVALLVHHLWVAPLRKEDTRLGHAILRACTNVRVLACDARSLVAAIAKSSRPKHTMCFELTLLLSRPGWETYLDTPSGRQFIRRLTRLRVMSKGTIPRLLTFPGVTHLSYVDHPPFDLNSLEYPCLLDDPDTLPSLQTIVLTRRREPTQHPPERIGPGLVILSVPHESIEMQSWRDSVRGRNLWDEAASIPLTKPHRDEVQVNF